MAQSDRQKLLLLLNECKTQADKDKKLSQLQQIEEIILRPQQQGQQSLFTGFLPSILEFHLDSAPQVRRFLAAFIEKAVKVDPNSLCTHCCFTIYFFL